MKVLCTISLRQGHGHRHGQRRDGDVDGAVNATTSEMIGGTARALRQQGVDIQQRASSAMLDMQALEEAFGEVIGAIDDLSRYRQEALPRLDDQIDRLATLAGRGGQAIDRLARGRDADDGEASRHA